ncbi:unnamed protein product [Schistocephalus solidus]|uniref:Ion_trans_2 domain-containing protein n=1 Tax=Schistocephalus solidus TaxID=70667 RepID=A0A183SZV7_SCHSO|nr:unnamed protein product [Schistocephalus solidus]
MYENTVKEGKNAMSAVPEQFVGTEPPTDPDCQHPSVELRSDRSYGRNVDTTANSIAHFERLLAEISNAPSTRLVQLIYEESSHLRRQILEGSDDGSLATASSTRNRFFGTTPSGDHEKSTNRSTHSTGSDPHLDSAISLQTYDIASAWDFDKALFFCATVVTTIGYGRLAPKTPAGKVFCIIFGCIGIPFTIFLSSAIVSACIPWLLRWREWRISEPRFERYENVLYNWLVRSSTGPGSQVPISCHVIQRRPALSQLPSTVSRTDEGMVNLSFDEREDSRHLVADGTSIPQHRFIHRHSKSLSSLHYPSPSRMTRSTVRGLLQRSSSSNFTFDPSVEPEVRAAVVAVVDLEPPSSLATSTLAEDNFRKEEVEREIVRTEVKACFEMPPANVVDREIKARFGGRLHCKGCPRSMSSSCSFSSFRASEKLGLFNDTVKRPRSYNSLSCTRCTAESLPKSLKSAPAKSTEEQHERRIETLVFPLGPRDGGDDLLGDDWPGDDLLFAVLSGLRLHC